jgi:hypothetical protein
MNKVLALSAMLSLLALPVSADGEWKLLKDKSNIKVFARNVEDSAYDEFRGVAVIEAPLASVLGVLDDVSACPEWINYCASSVILDDNGHDERHIYQINDLPFPAANRDVVARVVTTHDVSTGVITINSTARSDYYPMGKQTRVAKSDGFFQLTAITASTTEVVWQHHVEPGGVLPGFLANSMIVDLPFKSLLAMRSLAQKEKYQRLQIEYDENGKLAGLQNRSW